MADILVVDDDASVADALHRFLESEGHRARVASSVGDGLACADDARPDLVMMDVRMPGVDGLAGLDLMQAKYPGLRVVMMTGYGTSQTSIDAMRAGAFDYITKPPDLDVLRRLIARALVSRRGDDTAEPGAPITPSLIGDTPPMLDLYKMIGRLATNDLPALFIGEHGTGKTLAIRQLHDSSPRSHEALVRIDCSLPEPQVASAIFGEGIGTMHLAAIDALSASLQARLVRAMGDGAHARSTERIRARVVASAAADLAPAVTSGAFSRDLYDIISLITIRIPPLREHREDLPLLMRHFVSLINAKLNRAIRGVDEQAAKRLHEHTWPGNVGELERVLTRAALVAGGDIITSNDVAFLTESVFLAGNDGISGLDRAVRAALQERLIDAPSAGGGSVYHQIVDAVEAALVKEALAITNGNQVKASELLGLNRATLRKKAPAD